MNSTAIPWKEYLTDLVESFRDYYEKLSKEEKRIAQLNTTFVQPCQIEVFSFQKPRRDMLLVSFDRKRPDKEFIIHDNIGIDPEVYVVERAKSDKIFKRHKRDFISALKSKGVGVSWSWIRKDMSVYYFEDLRKDYPDPKIFSFRTFEDVRYGIRVNLSRTARLSRYDQLLDKTNKLEQQLKQISDDQLRTSTLATTAEISSSIFHAKKVDEHEKRIGQIERDIGGMRRIIGVSQEFQDWRVMASEVEALRNSSVGKDLFESELKRLDQRIDALREIKFWSKRTIIDIVLAVIATASTMIAALFAAGILKF